METMKWYGLDLTEIGNEEYVQIGWRWRADRETREYLVSGIIGGIHFIEEFTSENSQDNKLEAHEFFWSMESKLLA